jgi:hypothetical protein
MIDPGSVAIGALCIIALLAGFVGYLFRGHRIDATGLKVVNVWQENDHRASFGPRRIIEKDRDPKQEKPEDFYEMAKERDPE